MRAKWVINAALGLFLFLAVALIARQSMKGREPVSSAPSAPTQSAAVLPVRADPTPQTAVSAPVASNQDVAPRVVDVSEKPAEPAPRARKQPTPAAKEPEVPAPKTVPPAHKVVAMYFHGDIRCATCRKVEAYAKEAVEEGFKEQVAAGGVEFRAVNVERPENRHFIQDYQLTNKSVVVADEVGNAVTRWVKLDNVWGLVGNHDAYLVYVQDAVRAYVEN